MRHFFGYIRVSTVKQGEGVSLEAQKEAILGYARRHTLDVAQWFEEKETAAKRGRPIFSQMLKLLQKEDAHGVIMHKIDRGARNLKDWADLAELLDHGIEVHFANESLDLHSRGGRLSADIQAVVAADYIRNLREETKKGFYGRLKQGIYPLPAPIGYVDMGKGKAKELDPVHAPLVHKAFELYSTAQYNLDQLRDMLFELGLRTPKGSTLSKNCLSGMLNNPFYIGIIRLHKTGEMFNGLHKPLIAKSLFEHVQQVLRGKFHTRSFKHEFLFSRLLQCKICGHYLSGEIQKGNTYYRCHTPECPTTCIREDAIEQAILDELARLQFSQVEQAYMAEQLPKLKGELVAAGEELVKSLNLQLHQLQDRVSRLTDAYIDRVIDKETFEERKKSCLLERKDLEQKLADAGEQHGPEQLEKIFELANSAYASYKLALPEEKRDSLRILTSNRYVEQKNVIVELNIPFREIANRAAVPYSSPYRDELRTTVSAEHGVHTLLLKILGECRSHSTLLA
jgi:DNA invertase Pin-like site-specific DNA recombinase